jgi:hypothetical protein
MAMQKERKKYGHMKVKYKREKMMSTLRLMY